MKPLRLLGPLLPTLALLVVVACAQPSSRLEQQPTPSPTGGELNSVAKEAVETAKADLAERKRIPEESIVVAKVEAVSWPDASLGCPEPGMVYAQVVTPGYAIILEYGLETHEYHSDEGRRVVYCGQVGEEKSAEKK